ncbi:MAG: transporter [Planctomycetota bacterium]|nr:MAG: transporter [Planctomycetota bacterium]
MRDMNMGGLFGLTTKRPVAVAMAFVTLFTFGFVSLSRLPLNLLPDISYPRATVRAEYPGAAPEDVEERVTKRLHEALSVLGNLENISSVSRAGLADVTLEFTWGTNLTFAIQDIRERLDRANLPLEVGTPIILRYDPTLDPVLILGLTGGRDELELRRLAEDRLETALSTVEGVAAVRVRGGLEDEIRIELIPERLATHNLTPAQVSQRLSSENVNLASGTVLEGDTEYLVRILNEYVSPNEIADTVLFRNAGGVVRLRDVAVVRRTPKERDVLTRIDGQLSVELQVFKEAGANIVELAANVRSAVFGNAQQRAWVAGLRSGAIPDPDAAWDAFNEEIEADPEKRAVVQRLAQQERAFAAMMAGGGPPPGAGGGGNWQPPEDTRTEAQKAFENDLATRRRELRAALNQKDTNFDYLAANLPADVRVHLLSDQSRFIENALTEVREAGLSGAILAVLVLYLFLRQLGTTLIIAVAIPVSVLVTFAPLHLSGTSLNVMSLGGLALGIGMVVDNAIVVLESIARLREQGLSRAQAAVQGTREVAGAATASTLTTIAVFAPIIFVDGIAGQIFRDQALTVVASLAVSLIVALFLVPMLASRGGDGALRFRPWTPLLGWYGMLTARWAVADSDLRVKGAVSVLTWPLRALLTVLLAVLEFLGRVPLTLAGALLIAGLSGVIALALGAFWLVAWLPAKLFSIVYGAVERVYPPVIGGIVGNPLARTLVILVAGLLMWWTYVTAGSLGSELLPEVHQGEILGRLALPVGSPLEATDRVTEYAERSLKSDPEIARRIAWVSSTVGVPRDEISDPEDGEHTARLRVGVVPLPNESLVDAEDTVISYLRAQLALAPELRDMRFERPALFTMRAPIMVEIKGDDLEVLATVAREIESRLNQMTGLTDIRSSVQPGSPEVMLSFDRDLLSRYGLDTQQVASTVADMVKGNVATRFSDDDLRLDVLVQVSRNELTSVEELLALPVNPASASSEPLSALATSVVREGPREIRRIWGQRASIVSADVDGLDIGRSGERISEMLQEVERDHDVVIDQGGQSREMGGALGQMTQALLLAVFLVYVVMASIFESFLQPLIILVSVPLALAGAVGALAALDIPLSVVVFIGGIILAGIVVNNAIVLIDAINRRRRIEGMELQAAVRDACRVRLRPILMTTMTTVLGLLPLTGLLPFMKGGEGMELRAPMAISVVAGLSFATLLTLLVIPAVYTAVESLLERMSKQPEEAPVAS